MAEKICLHCTINAAVEAWVETHAKRSEDGKAVYNVGDIVAALTEVAGEYCEAPPTRHERRRALAFAHKALDASVQSVRTGTPVEVSMPQVH